MVHIGHLLPCLFQLLSEVLVLRSAPSDSFGLLEEVELASFEGCSEVRTNVLDGSEDGEYGVQSPCPSLTVCLLPWRDVSDAPSPPLQEEEGYLLICVGEGDQSSGVLLGSR